MEEHPHQRNKCSALFFGLLGGMYGTLHSKITGRPSPRDFKQVGGGLRSVGGAEELPDYQELEEHITNHINGDEESKVEGDDELVGEDRYSYRPEERPPSPIGSNSNASGSDDESGFEGTKRKNQKHENMFMLSEEEIQKKKDKIQIPEEDDLFSDLNKEKNGVKDEEWGEDVTIEFGE